MPFPIPAGESAWFAVTVRPRHEKTVARNLSVRGLQPFVPLYSARRRWSDRKKKVDLCLFPGYVFCRFGYEQRLSVLNLPSVTSIVGFGKTPAPIPEQQMEAIQTILNSGLPFGPWPFLKAGRQVRIEHGSMAGLEGVISREKDACRVVVNVDLLQRSVAVEIDREMVSPIL